jgi:hypothetical protein
MYETYMCKTILMITIRIWLFAHRDIDLKPSIEEYLSAFSF